MSLGEICLVIGLTVLPIIWFLCEYFVSLGGQEMKKQPHTTNTLIENRRTQTALSCFLLHSLLTPSPSCTQCCNICGN